MYIYSPYNRTRRKQRRRSHYVWTQVLQVSVRIVWPVLECTVYLKKQNDVRLGLVNKSLDFTIQFKTSASISKILLQIRFWHSEKLITYSHCQSSAACSLAAINPAGRCPLLCPVHTARRDETRQFCRVGIGRVNWASCRSSTVSRKNINSIAANL